MDPTEESQLSTFELINTRIKLIKTACRLCRLYRSCANLFFICFSSAGKHLYIKYCIKQSAASLFFVKQICCRSVGFVRVCNFQSNLHQQRILSGLWGWGWGWGWGGTPYDGLHWEALPERGTFSRLQVCERVGILLVEVYRRVGKSVIWVCERTQRDNRYILWLYKVKKMFYFCD